MHPLAETSPCCFHSALRFFSTLSVLPGVRHSRFAGRIDVREKVLHSDPAWKAARRAAEERRLELERQAAGEGGHYIPLLKGGTPRDEVRDGTVRALSGHCQGTVRALSGHWEGTGRALGGHWEGTGRAL